MEIGDIKHWLGNGTYRQGVLLYECLGKNQALKDLFKKGDLSFTRTKLRSALEQLLEESLAVTKPTPVSPSFPKKSPQTQEAPKRPAHPELNGRLRPLLDERTLLHAQLEYEGPLTRAFTCLRIVELTKQITAIYFHQEKPEVDPLDYSHIKDRAELKQQLANLRALRSKIKNKPHRHGELPELEVKIYTVSQLLNSNPND